MSHQNQIIISNYGNNTGYADSGAVDAYVAGAAIFNGRVIR